MPELIIYERPTCSTCRVAVSMLDASGKPFKRVRYYDEPLGEQKLRELLGKLGMKPIDIVRTKEPLFKELGVGDMPDDEIIAALAEHPDLLQRPIVEYGDRAVLGRPPEKVEAFVKEVTK
jgi:arsenate reductase